MEFSHTTERGYDLSTQKNKKEHGNCLNASTELTNQEEEGGSLADVDNVVKGFWSELYVDLLEPIACRLGIVELLGFRSMCKAWRSASFNASAEIESEADRTPWFLQYGDSCKCLLYDNSKDRHFNMNIPELEGTICIASDAGWLLVYRDGLIFFFCPFSRARIDLPPLPHSEKSEHVAAFSSSPTSQDCIVCVINPRNSNIWVLNLIRCGATEWTTHKYFDPRFDTITCASHYEGVFYFMNSMDALVIFSPEKIEWTPFRIVPLTPNSTPTKTLPFGSEKHYFSMKEMKKKLGLGEHVSISTCGTKLMGYDYNSYIHNENVSRSNNETDTHHVKAVWIHPRFHQIPPSYSWCP